MKSKSTTGRTPITPMRLGAKTLDDLDLVAADLSARRGIRCSRAEAVRELAADRAEKIRKKSGNSA